MGQLLKDNNLLEGGRKWEIFLYVNHSETLPWSDNYFRNVGEGKGREGGLVVVRR
jgi:hypothetical protein